MNLKGKVAIITGGSKGIGEKIAISLASEGIHLALVGRNQENLSRVAENCKKLGVNVSTFPFDLNEIQSIPNLVTAILKAYPQIDILINNAGIYSDGNPFTSSLSDWDYALNVNFRSAYHLTNSVLTSINKEGGSIINVSSIAGLMTYKGGEIYTATKHALKAYSGCLFESVREKNIKVTCIFPGYVNTEMGQGDNLQPEKMIQPEDIAEAVMWVIKAPLTACPTEITIRPQLSPYR
jgi:3-oxoacyl-[acyl-carrier protein] reductase